MNADGATNVLVLPAQLDRPLRIGDIRADGDHPFDARFRSAPKHILELPGQGLVREMTVRIDHVRF